MTPPAPALGFSSGPVAVEQVPGVVAAVVAVAAVVVAVVAVVTAVAVAVVVVVSAVAVAVGERMVVGEGGGVLVLAPLLPLLPLAAEPALHQRLRHIRIAVVVEEGTCLRLVRAPAWQNSHCHRLWRIVLLRPRQQGFAVSRCMLIQVTFTGQSAVYKRLSMAHSRYQVVKCKYTSCTVCNKCRLRSGVVECSLCSADAALYIIPTSVVSHVHVCMSFFMHPPSEVPCFCKSQNGAARK